jgi:large subunit ribosomal protein L23
VYTFDIRKNATKRDVAAAVKKLYKVDPIKVTTVNTPAKRVRMKTRRGFGKSTAGRKAYVTLKKGQEIQFS